MANHFEHILPLALEEIEQRVGPLVNHLKPPVFLTPADYDYLLPDECANDTVLTESYKEILKQIDITD